MIREKCRLFATSYGILGNESGSCQAIVCAGPELSFAILPERKNIS